MGRFDSGKVKNAWEKRLTFLGNSSLSIEESEIYLSSLPPSTGSNAGAVVRALASNQCGLGCNLGVDAICGLSLLLVLSFVPRGFLRVLRFSPLLKNQHFQIPIRTGIR